VKPGLVAPDPQPPSPAAGEEPGDSGDCSPDDEPDAGADSVTGGGGSLEGLSGSTEDGAEEDGSEEDDDGDELSDDGEVEVEAEVDGDSEPESLTDGEGFTGGCVFLSLPTSSPRCRSIHSLLSGS
jgi:hypothetical protein